MLESAFEYDDFKLSFTISVRAYLARYLVIKKAERTLNREFQSMCKTHYKQSLDFNTIFKWIVSPIVAAKIQKPANLEGLFWVNCNFAPDD